MKNCRIFAIIVQNTQFLSRQGFAFRGKKDEGKVDQLMKLSAKVSQKFTLWIG